MGCAEILTSLHFNQSKSAVLVELVGTFFLVLTASLATHEDAEVAPLAVGFMLMALIFAFGYISGGHFNPAVTMAAFLCRRCDSDMAEFKWYTALLYCIAQLLGAAGAGFYLLAVVGLDFPVPNTANEPAAVARGFFAESVYTFVLASVVMHVALSSQRKNDFYGFAIGMTVMSAALSVGGISGGAFNPAVATGLIVVKCFIGLRCESMTHLWMYWAAEAVGALVAVVLFNSVSVALDDTKKVDTVKLSPAAEGSQEMQRASSAEIVPDRAAPEAANVSGDADDRDDTTVAPVAPASVSPTPAKSPAAPAIRPMPTAAQKPPTAAEISAAAPTDQAQSPPTTPAADKTGTPTGRKSSSTTQAAAAARPATPAETAKSPAPVAAKSSPSASPVAKRPEAPTPAKDPKDDVSPLDMDDDDETR